MKVKKVLAILTVFSVALISCVTYADTLLPTVSDVVGNAMPSLCEALGRYPEKEESKDGNEIEYFSNVTENDFDFFSTYLAQNGASLTDYQVNGDVLSAEIKRGDAVFYFEYNSVSLDAKTTYPEGTYDEYLESAKSHFIAAEQLLKSKELKLAYSELLKIPNYEQYGPASKLLRENKQLAKIATEREEKLKQYRTKGNTVTFGKYYQTWDALVDDKPTDIEWIVLDSDDTRCLLISKYCIDYCTYNEYSSNRKDEYTTWEKCTLRKWLNSEFMEKAFSKEEQNAICLTHISNANSESYPDCPNNGGNDTEDKVFLLSFNEAFNKYFSSDSSRIAYMTDYQNRYGGWTNTYTCNWWLRSPGGENRMGEKDTAVYVTQKGTGSYSSSYNSEFVRPVLWLDLLSVY